MNGRTIFRVLAVLLLVAVAVGIGTAVYNVGINTGLNEAAQQAIASGEPLPAGAYHYGYGPYWHGAWGSGFGFFGIFFWILGIFLVFALLRAAFGWGRWGGGPGGPYGGRRDMIEDWHREMHRRDEGGAGTPPSDQRAGS
jgi:hypothetical protein